MTPERVINAGSVYGEQWERDAKQVVHEERVVIVFRTARERVVEGRQRHAYLENKRRYYHSDYHLKYYHVQEDNFPTIPM